MDDYLAKPIEIRTLNAMLDRWIAPGDRAPSALPRSETPLPVQAAKPHTSGEGAGRVVDTRNLEAVYGRDTERLARVLADWRGGIEDAVRAITRAFDSGSTKAAIEAAHRIKGSAGIAGAYGLSMEAGALETALRDGDAEVARRTARRVETLAAAAVREVAAPRRDANP
jgi:HPt (histidine-containing phosphotransfer) domain-containing protein